ncbi:MAG: hypothetical protein AB1490_25470 [Pseudomonadota bacterium]
MAKNFEHVLTIGLLFGAVAIPNVAAGATLDDVLARLDRLEAENAALRDRLQRLEPSRKSKQPNHSVSSATAAYAAAPTSPIRSSARAAEQSAEWQGLYWGASFGGVYGKSRTSAQETYTSNNPGNAPPNNVSSFTALSQAGSSGGAGITADLFAGINVMLSPRVLAGLQLEGTIAQIDFHPSGTKSYTYFNANGPTGQTASSNFQPHAYARGMLSVLARSGWLADPSTLVYAVGGWTLAKFEYHNVTDNLFYQPGETFWANGPSGGLGIERKIAANWSVRAEYRYTHFLAANVSSRFNYSTNIPSTQSQAMQARFENDMHVVRLGVAYLSTIAQ